MSKRRRKVRRLALAMSKVLPGHMMPNPRFDEADDPFAADHDGAFGGRDGSGKPRMALGGETTYGEAMVQHYLKERERSRALYLKLAQKIVDRERDLRIVERSR